MLVETTACQSWPVFETRCGSCARTACVTRRCRQTSGQSPSPSCSTYPVPGLDSPKRLTGSESMDSYDAASAVATVRQTLLHLPNSVRLWMNNYLITFCHNQNHVLYSLLPPPSTASQNYHASSTASSQPTTTATYWTSDSNFITLLTYFVRLHRRRCKNNCT